MCDFCENGKQIENMQGYVSIREEHGTKNLCYDNSGDELIEGKIEINYCPLCGRKLSEETKHSDPIRQTIKEVAEEMPALGKYEGDYAFPCGAFGYMDGLYRVDFSCSNCGKRHEGVVYGTEIVCNCGKKIKTGS